VTAPYRLPARSAPASLVGEKSRLHSLSAFCLVDGRLLFHSRIGEGLPVTQEESTLFLPELWADTIICVSPCL
jgi:hypothetical protein